MIFCDSDHLQNKHEMPDMKRKYMNTDKVQWKEPELTTLVGEVVGGTNIQNKQAHVLHYVKRNRRLGLSPSRHW